MKVIFLDFDGVISTYQSKWNLSIEKLLLLRQIVDNTQAKIVVTSSWKVGKQNVEDFRDSLYINWRTNNIQSKNQEIMCDFVNSIYDITDSNGNCRGKEIQRWLDKHTDEVDSYVIIDDDTDMLDEQLYNFVQTDGYYGLSDRTVSLAIDVLNGNYIPNKIRLNTELLLRYREKLKENNN